MLLETGGSRLKKLRKLFSILLLAALALSGSAIAQTAVAPEDLKVIQDNIVLLHEVWNRHDMAGYTSHMTEDVEWINVVGDWWKGKAQVFSTLDRFHKTIFKDRQLHPAEKLSIREIAPHVIVSTMINPADAYTGQSGIKQPPTRNVLTLIWVKRDGMWLIAQAQNTIEAPVTPPKPN
jgi:uncharacterized protein (TIGR02246 family)